MHSFSERLATRTVGLLAKRPWLCLAAALIAWAALMSGITRTKANFTHTAFFRASDPLLQRFDAFERQFGNDDAVVVVIHSPSGVFDQDSATLIRDLTEQMWQVPEVIRVESLSNFRWVHAVGDDIEVESLLPDEGPLTTEILAERMKIALKHEVVPDYLVSQDAQTALIYARIKPGIDRPPDSQAIMLATRKLLTAFQRTDHQFFVTGGPAINFSFRESSQGDLQRLMPILLLLIIFFLLLQLRTISGVLLPLVVVFLSILAAVAVAGWTGIEFSSVTSILPQTLIAIGIADAVHIMATFIAARRRGLGKREAATAALTKNFVPTILTSASTAIGFFAFATAKLKPVMGLGVLAGTGSILAWFISYFTVGSLLFILPSWVRQRKTLRASNEAAPWLCRFSGFLQRRAIAVFVVFALLVGSSIVLATRVKVNSDPYKYFTTDYPLRKAHDFILSHLRGTVGFEVVLDAGVANGIKDPDFLRRAEQFERRVVGIEGINKTVSIVDVLRQTNRSLHGDNDAYYKIPETRQAVAQELFLYTMSLPQGMDVNDRMTIKYDALRVSVLSTITDSARWTKTAGDLERIGKELNIDAKVTGKTMLYQMMNGYVVQSFVQSLTIAVLLISLLLFAFFRSPKVGIVALIPNLIPLVLGAAVVHILGATLDIGTVLVGSVCFGVAVDDTIHILSNYKRYVAEGLSSREAIERVLTHTGPALVITTLVLVAAFGSLAFATFIPNVFFGILSSVVLITALITDLIFLPALLMFLEPKETVA